MSQGKRVAEHGRSTRRAENENIEREEKRGHSRAVKTGAVSAIAVLAAILVVVAIALIVIFVIKPKPEQKRPVSEQSDTQAVEIDEKEPEKVLKEDFYTFVLVGTNDDYNADTIMLGSLDMNTLKCNMISIPRDSMVDTDAKIKKINGVYGREKIDGLCEAIFEISGVYPQYYCVLNMKAFIKVVDIIGGVRFNVPMRMYHPDAQSEYTIDLQKGWQTLNGKKALQLVRFRGMKGSDFGRQDLQKEFLVATLNTVKENFSISKAGEIITTMAKSIKTNMDVDDMIWFYTNAISKMDLANDITFHTMPHSGEGVYGKQEYIYLDKTGICELVNETVNPFTTPITEDELNIIRLSD